MQVYEHAPLDFWQIGSEGGFLPEPVQLSRLLMAPAERADVIVDFTGCHPGDTILLRTSAPTSPSVVVSRTPTSTVPTPPPPAR